MRNLKRALSLTLASVMLLGMMVVGGSAVGYPDVDKNDNVEAIEVLQAVGIMGGDNNGNFNPDDYVTREQMAVIMSQLLKLDYNYYKGTNPFSDVPEWAAPYVAACAANGITAGIGDGLYGSKQNIQAVQAALMMLKALGYFQYAGDYEGGYVLATVKQASEVGLFDGIDSESNADLTRNQVAQMVLNALQADMVSFTGDPGVTYTGSNGESWVGGYKAEYTPRTSTQSKYQAIERRSSDVSGDANHRGQYYIQLGEELYNGDLRLNDNAIDEFGRPARNWEYKGNEVGTYMKKELIRQEWTVKVTGRMLYDLLTASVLRDYHTDIYVDGILASEATQTILGDAYFTAGNLVRGNTDTMGETGNGVLTQVFVDPNAGSAGEVTIAIINTYLAKATEDYNDRNEDIEFRIWGIKSAGRDQLVKNTGNTDYKNVVLKAEQEDFDVEDYKKDDIVMVTVAQGAIQSIGTPEVLSEVVVSGFKSGRGGNLTTGGTKYNYNDAAKYDDEPGSLLYYTGENAIVNLKDKNYNVYLDNNGYVIGVELVDPEDNYVFVTGIDSDYSNISSRNYDVKAIFLDGNIDVIKVNGRDSDEIVSFDDLTVEVGSPNTTTEEYSIVNRWYSYTVSKDGVYTLKNVTRQYAQDVTEISGVTRYDINAKDISLPAHLDPGANAPLTNSYDKYVYGNDESVYITVSLDNLNIVDSNGAKKVATVIDDVESVATGIKNVDIKVEDVDEDTAHDDYDAKVNTSHYFPSAEIYTLWDSNNWVIGAVVIGEDQGISSNFAYVHSGSVKQETYTDEDGNHTWYRDVLIDGKVTELTYKGDSINVLDRSGTRDGKTSNTLDQGYWYKIFYNADGTVRRTEEMQTKIILNDDTDQGADTVPEVVATLKGNVETVVYRESGATKLYYENGSLYVTNNNGTNGFPVRGDVKVAYINADGHDPANPFDTTIDGLTGYSGLETALSRLNNNNPFQGDICAVLERGGATTIVINCTARYTGYNPGTTTQPSSTFQWLNTDDVTAPTYKGNTAPTNKDIYNMLADKGYTNIGRDGTTNKWTYTDGDFTESGVTITPVRMITIKVDSTEKTVTSTTSLEDLYKEKYSAADGNANIFMKWVDASETVAANKTKYTNSGDTNGLGEGDEVFTDKYLKVAGTPVTSGTGTAPTAAANDGGNTYTLTSGTVTDGTNSYIKDGETVTISVKVTCSSSDSTINADVKATVVPTATVASASDQTPASSTNLFTTSDAVTVADGCTKTITLKVTASATADGDVAFTINWAA